MEFEYTPEERNRLEIEKLYAEVVDLKSWVRRWLGTLGGLLGIVTAAASVVVTSTQWSRSTREADLKMKQAEARLAEADKRDARRLFDEISAQTETKNAELATLEKRLKEATDKLATATESARALAVAAKPRAFSVKALDLILQSEGLDQPGKWPGGSSGITIGLGYDLGLVTKESFESDWKNHLLPAQIARLSEAIGLTGASAQALTPRFGDIIITREAAVDVFERGTLPQFVARTAEVFPGFDKLPLDAQGALVALVSNRGTGLEGDRRKEMRAIRDLVPSGDLAAIAREIRAMKRLWPTVPSLVARREAEAALLESAK